MSYPGPSTAKPIKKIEVVVTWDKQRKTKHFKPPPGKVFTPEGVQDILDQYATQLEKSEKHDFRFVELGPDRFIFVGEPKERSQYYIGDRPVSKEEFTAFFEVSVKESTLEELEARVQRKIVPMGNEPKRPTGLNVSVDLGGSV